MQKKKKFVPMTPARYEFINGKLLGTPVDLEAKNKVNTKTLDEWKEEVKSLEARSNKGIQLMNQISSFQRQHDPLKEKEYDKLNKHWWTIRARLAEARGWVEWLEYWTDPENNK